MAGDDLVGLDAEAATAFESVEPLTSGTYVRLVDGLVMLPVSQGLLVEGGLRRRVLAGGAGAEDILRVAALLDGSRTLQAVALSSGLTYEATRRIVSMLRVSDFVEYRGSGPGVADDSCAGATDSALAFLARTVHATGHYNNTAELRAALGSATVMILAPGPAGDRIHADLVACGVGHVAVGGYQDGAAVALAGLSASQRSLVVTIDDGRSAATLTSVEALCRQHEVPMLRCARRGSSIEIGPLFYAGSTACYGCFDRSYYEQRRPGTSGPARSPLDDRLDDCLVAMTVDEVLATLGQVRPPATLRTINTVSLASFSERRSVLLPRPGCAQCGTLFPSATAGDSAAAYEWVSRNWPPRLGGDQALKLRYGPALRDLAAQRPRFTSHPVYPLPSPVQAAGSDGGPAPDRDAPLTPATLAALLNQVAGRRSTDPAPDLRRWAPSGGNLASARLYCVAWGVPIGPGAGVLALYDDIRHALIPVHSGTVPAQRILARTGMAAAEPSVLLVFVADVDRIAQKYGPFGYRLAHLDAGVATAQLAVVASALGLGVAFAPAWPDSVAELLELRPGREFVTSLALVTPGGGN
jgi:bacteriocin biosynthesis cyclodehydratase domain-containing protein